MARILFFISILLMSCSDSKPKQDDRLTHERIIKSHLLAFVDSCWNKKDMNSLKKLTTQNFVRNLNGIQVASNQSEMEGQLNVFFKAFPDGLMHIDKVYVQDNSSFHYWSYTGTNTDIFGETPTTGKKINVSGFSVIHYAEDGKMIQEDTYYNELGLLQQLGYSLIAPVLE